MAIIQVCVCSECNEPVEHVCSTCQNRAHEASCESHQQEQRDRKEADQARRAIPGVEQLEDVFDLTVEIDRDGDEDGPGDGFIASTKNGPDWLGGSGFGATEEEAVQSLRNKIASGLHFVAAELCAQPSDGFVNLSFDDAMNVIAALNACGHMGLAEKVRHQFGIKP